MQCLRGAVCNLASPPSTIQPWARLSHPELTEKPPPIREVRLSVYEPPGQKPSIFLRSSPLECKSGREQPPQRLTGKNCLFGQNNGIFHIPSKLVNPPSTLRKCQMEPRPSGYFCNRRLYSFYQLPLSPHSSV